MLLGISKSGPLQIFLTGLYRTPRFRGYAPDFGSLRWLLSQSFRLSDAQDPGFTQVIALLRSLIAAQHRVSGLLCLLWKPSWPGEWSV